MIHQLLALTRPLIVFDVESTGVDPLKDRIIELGFQLWDADGLKKEYRTLINPGIPIPPEATKAHHITDEMVQGCRDCMLYDSSIEGRDRHPRQIEGISHEFKPWPYFQQLASNLVIGFTNCDFAGKNVRFDLRIFAAEMARAKVEWSRGDARIVDAERLEQIAVPRGLSHLYEKYTGTKHDSAHSALGDARASTTIIVHQLQAHPQLSRDLDTLHTAQWGDMLDLDGKFVFINGVACVGRWGKHANKPMHTVPIDYYDFILGGDFSAEVKALARNAKLGKFPEKK